MELNEQQKKAAEYNVNRNILLLAGAGTGKTKTIIARAIYLIKSGVSAKRILLITFTRRAAKEMIHRLQIALGDNAKSIFTGTFHKFCLDVMKTIPKSFGIEHRTVIDRDDQLSLMRLARGNVVPNGTKMFPKAGILVNMLSYARNTNRPIKEYMEKYSDLDNDNIKRSLKIFSLYDNKKKEKGYLDFDDILFIFANTISMNDKIRNQLKGLFDHILVDEMQDTNPIQWLILEGLRDPAKLFCVGDDAQSIYAFRGADFKNIHSFSDRVSNSVILKLEKNYRSTQDILDISNWLIDASELNYEKYLIAHRGKGLRPRLLDFANQFDEARWIADDLMKRHEDGANWRDHMVLVRGAYLSRTLEGTLIEKNIPYRFIGGTGLMQSAHVKDLICMARAAESHRDELAWVRYLKCWPKIGDVTATKIVEAIYTCKNSSEAPNKVDKLLGDRKEITQGLRLILSYKDKPAEALNYGRKYLEGVLSKKYDRWDSRSKDLNLLVRLAKNHNSLSEFIETYTLDPISNTESLRLETEDAVTLITIHSAKGTEESVCYIIQAKSGVFPHVRSIGNKDDEEEERRVLYVAITRAKDELILTRSGNSKRIVFHNGADAETDEGGTPYFLADIPEHLVTREEYGFDRKNHSFLQDLEEV